MTDGGAIAPKVRGAFASVLGPDALTDPSRLRLNAHPAWDSLAHMDLVLAVERACGVAFAGHEIASLDSFDRMVAAVERKLAGPAAPGRAG